jgi:hypothetical protein
MATSQQSQRRPAAIGTPERLLLERLNDLRKRVETDIAWAEFRRLQRWREQDGAHEDRSGLMRFLSAE